MSLPTAITAIKAKVTSAFDAVKADASKLDQAKTDVLSTVDSELGAVATELTGVFTREETKAAAWEGRHLKLLNLIALGGWVAAVLAIVLRLHG